MSKIKNNNYNPSEIEKKWQKIWEEKGIYRAANPRAKGKKFYTLIEFPYPSGAGLHVGHVRSWAAMDAFSRRKRMQGFNVLYPIGWDAFGLPAENYAIKMKIHPSIAVEKNIANFKRQIKSLGLSFDWSREINTTDPKYYKWTQWIFLKFLEKGLAFQADVPVNWCPFCKTNLADEEVLTNGTHERCGTQTEKRLQKQWLLKITAYADRLLEDLKLVDYSSKISTQQINWIGKKQGIEIKYRVASLKFNDEDVEIKCFTTRPDTNFGATFIVLGPEHPLVASLLHSKFIRSTSSGQNSKLAEIKKYVNEARKKSEIDRIAEGRKKTGVFTGFYAINNLNGKKLPIWISDFVLGNVGTGAVVGVPGHDIRDFEFAKEFNIPIIRVMVGKDGDTSEIARRKQVQEEQGKMINSEFLNGLDIHVAIKKIMDYLEEKGWGKRVTSYHLRDWIFSRQHYWGEPIPVIHCKDCGIVPVPEKDLPVELPYLEKYEPSGTGKSPLAKVPEWVNVSCPKCGGKAIRETDTMPNWAGSNWYFLRYLDTQNDSLIADPKLMKFWMPVDLYQGGFEHTTLHLLYSRFVYKFLYDIGVVPTPEPYAKRRSHGIVLGPDGRKMSKSFDNVINPDDISRKFGADTLRVYEMFMGPFDQTIAWSEESVEGCFRFLKRVWQLSKTKLSDKKTSQDLLASLNKTVKKVDEDLENMKFNTAVATMMAFVNNWQADSQGLYKKDFKTFLLLLAPFVPHMAEELFQNVILRTTSEGSQEILRSAQSDKLYSSIHLQQWPKYDPKFLVVDEVIIAVQVNGKLRDTIKIKNEKLKIKNVIEQKARESAKIKKHLEGITIKKIIYVEGKVLNFVAV